MKKKFILFFFIFFPQYLLANDGIVYLDVQYIIDNSFLGIHYKKKIKLIEDENKSIILNKKKLIKSKEQEINNQKNILKKEEIDDKIIKINKLLKEYQIDVNKLNNKITAKKKEYTNNILKIMNPLLTKYVEKNNIFLVLEKKNILVGIKTLDITNDILKILDQETKTKNLINEN
tara:strand:+ start:396 stop:920 length:525 start_codon:yes stop_codon:yes gene_type:complete